MSDEKILKINPPETMEDVEYSPELLEPMKTGSNLDYLLSIKGGIMRGANIMVSGDPGIGKSTLLLDILSRLQKQGKRILFISAEMNRLDVFKITERFKSFKKIPMIFMDDYEDSMNPIIVLKAVLNQGYDVVVIDSMVEVINIIAEFYNATPKQATSIFLDVIGDQNEGKNEKSLYTSFLLIQQVTKGGVFVGSNRLKHMTQATMELKYEDPKNKMGSYVVFSKNRDGVIGEKVDFNINSKENSISENEIIYQSPTFYVEPKKKKGKQSIETEPDELDVEELLEHPSTVRIVLD